MKFRVNCLALLLAASAASIARAETGDAGAAAQANNPLANMTAFNIHHYYVGEITDSDHDSNQLWLRYAKPFSVGESNWLMRASLPINSFPVGRNGATETGLGDFNIFASYLFDTDNPAVSFGVGPQLTVPTATEDALGSEQWSAGLASVMFNASSPKLQWGYLLTWQHSFAGEDDRDDVNVGAFQPFLIYQLGGGTYLRSAAIWVYDFERDNYNVPLGLGIGQVIKQGNTVYNAFIEPQFSVADDGPGQPEWQIFFGFNMQFY